MHKPYHLSSFVTNSQLICHLSLLLVTNSHLFPSPMTDTCLYTARSATQQGLELIRADAHALATMLSDCASASESIRTSPVKVHRDSAKALWSPGKLRGTRLEGVTAQDLDLELLAAIVRHRFAALDSKVISKMRTLVWELSVPSQVFHIPHCLASII